MNGHPTRYGEGKYPLSDSPVAVNTDTHAEEHDVRRDDHGRNSKHCTSAVVGRPSVLLREPPRGQRNPDQARVESDDASNGVNLVGELGSLSWIHRDGRADGAEKTENANEDEANPWPVAFPKLSVYRHHERQDYQAEHYEIGLLDDGIGSADGPEVADGVMDATVTRRERSQREDEQPKNDRPDNPGEVESAIGDA